MSETTVLELRPATPSWHLPVIAGQFRQWPDLIIAEYTREQLFWALACVLDDAALLRLTTEQKRTIRLRGEARRLRGL